MKRTVSKFLVGALALSGALVAISAGRASATSCAGTLRQGATGHCVGDVQYMLNYINTSLGQQGRVGYAPVPPQLATDSIFGPATAFTVGHYQSWKHRPVDGVVHLVDWGDYCNETAIQGWQTSPYASRRQAVFAAVDAGCVLHPG